MFNDNKQSEIIDICRPLCPESYSMAIYGISFFSNTIDSSMTQKSQEEERRKKEGCCDDIRHVERDSLDGVSAEPGLFDFSNHAITTGAHAKLESAPFSVPELHEVNDPPYIPTSITNSFAAPTGLSGRVINSCFSPNAQSMYVIAQNQSLQMSEEPLSPLYKDERQFISSSSKRVLFSPM